MASEAIPAPTVVASRVADADQIVWSLPLRIAFRFAFVYFLLYCAPFPLFFLPYTEQIGAWFVEFWHVVVPWVGAHVLHLPQPITVFENGSGDTTYNWVLVGCFLAIATLVTVLWSILDRKRQNYDRLYRWSRLYLRVWLGTTLCSYGAAKVIQSQFPPPALSTLIVPYAQHSPMGLLWTFMGMSTAYNVFAGSAEMLAGILLLIPRVTTLGALLCAAVMSNVFMLNMSYDVPVKLFSFHLLVAALVLAGPDLANVTRFLVLKRPAQLTIDRPFFSNPRLNLAGLALQLLFAAFIVAYSLYSSLQNQQMFGDRPLLYGVWSVARANVDWGQVVFDHFGTFAVQSREGAMEYYFQKTNAAGHTITITSYRLHHPKSEGVLRFIQTPPNELQLSGQLGGRRVVATLHRVDETKFLLLRRGFHWISEHPFNR